MITNVTQIIKQYFTPIDYKEIAENAHFAEIGGKSCIRTKEDRKNNLSLDQLNGMFGHWALSMWATGSANLWREQRIKANKTPTKGDGGIDLIIEGVTYDVKTSGMRGSSDPLRYNLPLRPRERHEEVCYVLALHPTDANYVWLVGKALEKDFPKTVSETGIFKGAFVIPACKLTPMYV
jgi:hypothetical protein